MANSNIRGKEETAYVIVCSEEMAASDYGPQLSIDGPRIAIEGEHSWLTAGQARQVAALLVQAADTLEQIPRDA